MFSILYLEVNRPSRSILLKSILRAERACQKTKRNVRTDNFFVVVPIELVLFIPPVLIIIIFPFRIGFHLLI